MDVYNIDYDNVIILQYGDADYPEASDDESDADE